MSERPILFSAPMVRALLAGTKTQTRRVVKPQPEEHHWQGLPGYELKRSEMVTIDGRCAVKFAHSIPHNRAWDDASRWVCCPYGQPGGRLWVRETWGYRCSSSTPTAGQYMHTVAYRADDARQTFGPMPHDGVGLPEQRAATDGEPWQEREDYLNRYWRQWRPSIHMPRWASRITLEVTGVRVERLQSISEADAMAEGVEARPFPGPWWQGYRDIGDGELMHQQAIGDTPPDWMIEPKRMRDKTHLDLTAVDAYRALWESINGPGSWDANPWVWCVSFRRITP